MDTSFRLPSRLRVIEVGPRDGFQMEETFVPTETKVEAIDRLARGGLREIEAVSFVSPRVIPQMRDAAAVMARIERVPGVRYWALVPNQRGAERALEAGASGVHLVICATETYNRRNVGRTIDQSLAELERIAALAPAPVAVAVTMAAAFGCPFEGEVAEQHVVALARRFAGAGARELGLADSAGLGNPPLVRRVVRAARAALPDIALRLHLHDTRGLGLANAFAGLEAGITAFDTALGGLGGCPIMRGASGNIATEDLVNLAHELGITTGVDLEAVRGVSRLLEQVLGRRLPARLLHAGTRAELYALNRDPPS